MALKVTYWTASKYNPNLPGAAITSESFAISGTSARTVNATPANAMFVSIRNTEAGDVNYSYTSATSTAIASVDGSDASSGIGSGERLWIDAIPTFKVAGITATS